MRRKSNNDEGEGGREKGRERGGKRERVREGERGREMLQRQLCRGGLDCCVSSLCRALTRCFE